MTSFRFLFLFFFTWSITCSSWCQKFPDISAAKTQFLEFDTARYTENHKIPFKKIEILDYRFDTTKVGYTAYRRTHEKLAVKGSLQSTLTAYLNNYFRDNLDSSSSRTLVIVLKKLWLQYGATNQMLRSKDIDHGSILNYMRRNTVCLANAEVFAGSGETYQALVKLSHNFTIEEADKKNNLSLLLLPFDSLIQKINSLDVEATLIQKKFFLLPDIHANYQKRFDLPMLIIRKLSRGIYVTFDDFKNNKVSYPDFMYKTSKYSADVTITQNGKEIILTEYWGFFDGKNLWAKPGLIPFKTVRQGNTFDLYGSLRGETFGYSNTTFTQIGPLTTNNTSSFIPAHPLQIDMETGKVY